MLSFWKNRLQGICDVSKLLHRKLFGAQIGGDASAVEQLGSLRFADAKTRGEGIGQRLTALGKGGLDHAEEVFFLLDLNGRFGPERRSSSKKSQMPYRKITRKSS